MQTSAQTFKAAAAPRSVATRAARRAAPAVRCQQGLPQAIKEVAKGAALAAAAVGLVLGTGMPAEAAKSGPTAYEKELAYQQELLETLKARGKELPALSEAPQGTVTKEAKIEPLKISKDEIQQVLIETPAAVPEPEAPAPAAVEAPAPAPAAVVAPIVAAPAPAPAPAPVAVAPAPAVPVAAAPAAAEPEAVEVAAPAGADNKGLIAGAALATVAIVAVAGAGAQGNLEGVVAGSEGAPAAAPPAAAAAASGVPPNVAEARAWIAAWKAKQQK